METITELLMIAVYFYLGFVIGAIKAAEIYEQLKDRDND